MMDHRIFSDTELLAVRFYMGDPDVAEKGLYQGGVEAYNTINALMHPGSANEKDKAREGRVIRLEGVSHLKSYLELIQDIYRAMEKYRRYCSGNMEHEFSRQSECNDMAVIGRQPGYCEETESDRQPKQSMTMGMTYRMDRLASLQRFEEDHHRVAGFFSTCKRGFLPEYARRKVNVVMLEVERDLTVPFLDFEDIFEGCYAKPEEAEILLPFGMIIDRMELLTVTAQETELYRDMNGQPPAGKWRLHMTMDTWPQIPEDRLWELYLMITFDGTVGRVMDCMDKLTAGRTLTDDEEQFYCVWKAQLQQYIMGRIRHGIVMDEAALY